VITAALIFLFLLDRPTEEVVQHHGMNQAQNLAVGRPDVAKDLSKQVADSITRLRATLDGVTDVASAQAALPKLQEASAQIDRTSGEVGQLSADQRKLVAGLVNPLVPVVNQLCDKVLAIPGVAEALKPSVDTLRAKLTAFVVEVNKMEG
jgi:ABC-type transporter Mla subunit MlaD